MPLDRLVLVLVIVTLAALASIWVGAVLVASTALPAGLLALVPAALVAMVLWRVVADRGGDTEDDRYDRMDRDG